MSGICSLSGQTDSVNREAGRGVGLRCMGMDAAAQQNWVARLAAVSMASCLGLPVSGLC